MEIDALENTASNIGNPDSVSIISGPSASASRDLRQRPLAARLVQLLEPIEAVSAAAKHLARPGYGCAAFAQLQQPELVLADPLPASPRGRFVGNSDQVATSTDMR